MNVEVVKFKKLLEWFVEKLKVNNNIIFGEKVSGQGYKGHKIREYYSQWREYDGFSLDIAMQVGYQKDTQANYIHCTQTWMNIVPIFDKTSGQSMVTALQIVYKPDNKVVEEGTRHTLYKLGIGDGKEANDVLVSFFNEYKSMIFKYIKRVPNEEANTKQWWIKELNLILKNSKYVAMDNPTVTEDNVIVVEKGTQRPHYIGLKPKKNDRFGTWIKRELVDAIKNRKVPSYTELIGNVYHYQSIDDFGFVIETAKILANGIKSKTELPPERKETKNMELNTILYGPPGTGKTYHTALYAVSIIEETDIELLKEEEYSEILDRYNMYKEAGLIEFTTFHQSYGYEEFIEGIKPVVSDDGEMTYKVVPGAFKRFCDKASTPKSKKLKTNSDPVVWKVSLAKTGNNPVRSECLNNGHIRIGWDEYGDIITEDTDFNNGGKAILNAFINEMREGDIVVSCYSENTADAIGIVTGPYSWHPEYSDYKRVRPVKWIVKGNFNITDINGGKNMTLSTVYKLNNIELDKLFAYMADQTESVVENKDKHVFIIDEINRGNVSKILGEAITLIETGKRKGAEEELQVTLPYSGKKFGVPDNIYIIGTMNTADRSIATLDTALRRRFFFKEMLPDANVLNGIAVNGVSISGMLERINQRIEVLYDREHTIGHAYFMSLKNDPTIETLAKIFENNIIPLLQEYFYEDYEKIRLVLGDSKKSDENAMFIIARANNYSDLFGNVDIGLDDGYNYKINKKAFTNIEAYKSI